MASNNFFHEIDSILSEMERMDKPIRMGWHFLLQSNYENSPAFFSFNSIPGICLFKPFSFGHTYVFFEIQNDKLERE